ncbi:MAG TPA: hypothetical protein PL033_07430 [Candidatus Brocadiia bacterium]|nr:hypothetical protein [Candidatus Brocadiia bacterium]
MKQVISKGAITLVFALNLYVFASAALAGPNAKHGAPIDIRQTVLPSALHDLRSGGVVIAGRTAAADGAKVLIRVTTSAGESITTQTASDGGMFRCVYPRDFEKAPPLSPCCLFIDATNDSKFDTARPGHFQAECVVIVYDGSGGIIPEMPSAFTNDLLDAKGRTDGDSSEWAVIRPLANLYMRSQAARTIGVGKPDFDLAVAEDMLKFRDDFALYDFSNRDRDWSIPLGRRPARTFWQAVWTNWFNPTNNHPQDGDPKNNAHSNFVPYAFANDFADILITYLMRMDAPGALDDNLKTMCAEGLENLMAMQHREDSNFAKKDAKGREHVYTRGAFRYGLFENGEFLTEGTGWFYNPEHSDYAHGGVLNGRAVWAIGEGLKRFPEGKLSEQLKETMALGVKFCLVDAQKHGYAHRTKNGHAMWYDPGEQGYLLLGMIAACKVAPELPICELDGRVRTLRDFCADGLDALVDEAKSHGQWMTYADKDSMTIAAMADGVRVLSDHPNAAKWREVVVRAADGWIAAKCDPESYPAPLVHIPERPRPEKVTFKWGERNMIFFYKSGHWIHALAKMYDLTGDERYRRRAEAITAYMCGANPWRARMLNELGGIYNWVTDTDGDGIEDELKQDMYPESTTFCHIGVIHLMRAICRANSGGGQK